MVAANEEKQLSYSRPPLVPQPYPWLVICHGKHRQRQTFFSISENRYYTRIIPEMRNKNAWSSSYGWLVLEDLDTDDCFILNPLSMEKIQLPALEQIVYDICILSAPPSDPDCRVLFISSFESVALFCRPGDGKFVKQELRVADEYLMSATSFDGKIYGLMVPSYTLVTADFAGSTLEFRQLMREKPSFPSPLETEFFHDYLIEFCGELLLVHKIYSASFMREVIGFKIFYRDGSNEEVVWVELKSKGERIIFLSPRGGMCCFAAESGIRGNSIYSTQPYDRNLYVFDLEDRSISLSLPCPIVSRRESLVSWIMI